METIVLTGQNLNLNAVTDVAFYKAPVKLAVSAAEAMEHSRRYIESRLKTGEPLYGVNTGFGAFSSVRISEAQIQELQVNLIRSHAVGVGDFFNPEQVRAIMLLRASTLASGHSGVRSQVAEKLIEYLNHNIIPAVPAQGSVGASGDLAPLAHIALTLIGEGWVLNESGNKVKVTDVLKRHSISPLKLEAKEGLSLINGCQVMTALGLLALHKSIILVKLADVIGALTLESLRGSRNAFDPLISEVRPHDGEIKTARNLRTILTEKTDISLSHINCDKVQDAYSLRCMPAVHGAVKNTLRYLEKTLLTEANSCTDNPLVFADEDKILSCGNFHGMPVALSLDYAAIALTTLGSISEQRLAKLINPAMNSGLPAFLAPEGGLNSGHMITHVVSAALASENKVLSHPASCDSIPTSADKEDHVSMGTIAARKLDQVVKNVGHILANELLAGAQAIDILRPMKSSPCLEIVYSMVRECVPFAQKDRVFGEDSEALFQLIMSGELLKEIENHVSLDW
jgi:histidine ammonia-lyase